MTAAELIVQLERMEPHMQVRYAYNYRDRAQTVVTEPITSVEEQPCRWSDYHDNYVLIDDDRNTINDPVETFVVLRY